MEAKQKLTWTGPGSEKRTGQNFSTHPPPRALAGRRHLLKSFEASHMEYSHVLAYRMASKAKSEIKNVSKTQRTCPSL